ESVKSFLAQEGIIFDRIARLTVMQGRARCKILCQLSTALLQAYVLLADLKLHASPFLPGIAPCQWPCSMLSDIHRGRVYPVCRFYSITCPTFYLLHGYVVQAMDV